MPEQVVVVYHREKISPWQETYWAESEQMPGFSAAADTVFDLMTLVREAVVDQFGPDVDHRSCWEGTERGVVGFKITRSVKPAA